MSSRFATFAKSVFTLKSAMTLVAFFMVVSSAPIMASEEESNAANKAPILSKEELAQVVANGKELAKTKCGSCHSITLTGKSDNTEAPPFRDFADKGPLEALEETLAEGIVTGHSDMPEIVMSPEEITAFLEFLRSLKKQ